MPSNLVIFLNWILTIDFDGKVHAFLILMTKVLLSLTLGWYMQ